MKPLGQVLAALGAVLLGYFGLIGVDTGIDGFRVTNLAGLFTGSALLVSGSVLAAAAGITEKLSELHATLRKVAVAEAKPKQPADQGARRSEPEPAAIRVVTLGQDPEGLIRKGEERFVEEHKGTPINKRYNGHFIGEKMFSSLQRAREHIDELAANKDI